ncbi:unnamed protein product [Gongylonema pulchrum]|uniref:NUC153 domain-containing protein n=1 Tax=Gongylonema pulchrum TaxID=637853 RepID=A0A183ESM1_9BILA|nr:unnamed protein product [Gongylonema pulchrum]
MDRESIGGRTRGSSVWLKNDDDENDDDDIMDLLDQNMMLKKIATSRPDKAKNKTKPDRELQDGEMGSGGFRLTKDGRLIIEDLDEANQRKRKVFDGEPLDISGKKSRIGDFENGGNNGNDDDDEGDGSDSDIETLVSKKSGRSEKGKRRENYTDASSKARFSAKKKQGASSLKQKRGPGDARRKGEKYEPYTYIPLRKRKGQNFLDPLITVVMTSSLSS